MRGLNLSRLYSVRFAPDDKERKDRVWRVLCRDFFQRYVDRSDTVLDIGAGHCEFINHIEAHRRIAFDLNPEVRARFLPFTSKSLLPQHPVLVRLYLKLRPAQWLLGRQSWIVAVRPR